MARALPHWSVTEFFEKLENFLGAEFDIDHKAKTIKFAFTSNVINSAETIHIDNVIDNYTAEVSDTDESNYIGATNIRYKECGHNMWKFYSCRWFVKDSNPLVYDTLSELVNYAKTFARVRQYNRGSDIHRLYYAKDVDCYFLIRCVRNEYVETRPSGIEVYDRICVLQPLNVFGDKIVDENNENVIELEFVPAWIDETEPTKGHCIFLDLPAYDEVTTGAGTRPDDINETASKIYQPSAMQQLQNGEATERTEYFDRIYLGFWDGINVHVGLLPRPYLDIVTIREDWSYCSHNSTLRILPAVKFSINPKQKYQFSFIADKIPNVRSVFHINGKKYLCEKITATFTENGMSQLLKGTFYPII